MKCLNGAVQLGMTVQSEALLNNQRTTSSWKKCAYFLYEVVHKVELHTRLHNSV